MSQSVVVTAPGSTAIVNAGRGAVVARAPETLVVTTPGAVRSVVVTRGVPGRDGKDATGALLVDNCLSEFNTPAARGQAQANLGLGAVDPLAYYILAKA